MAQDQDAYVRVGRGGAGNFHSSKPNPSKDANRDLEAAREPQLIDAIPPPSPPPPSTLARAGRGGAGNYVDSSISLKKEQELAGETATAVAASAASHPRGAVLGGRGGAGNWNTDGETRKLEEERRIGQEMEKKAIEAVDVGLKMPEKAHHAPLTTK